jgi:LSD1 subclass zinc finger protein
MKIVVFLNMKAQFVPHRRISFPLQIPAGKFYVRCEVCVAVTMKNAVFWDVTPCGSY